VRPAGLSLTVHEGHPFVAGVVSRRSPTLGVGASGDEGPCFPGAAGATQVAVHGIVDPVHA